MKRKLLAVFILAAVSATEANAQCSFTPVITPGNPVLCPDSDDTLFTTEQYDSYQWYKGDNPIAGATLPYLIVKNPGDVGKRFSVLATLNGCSEQSAKVLVDGWVFLLPYTIHSGDLGIYNPLKGAFINCPGDVHILQTSQPFVTNVQWYNNYKPIPGANSPELDVTDGKGSYTYSGSPDVCPGYVQFQGVPDNIIFKDSVSIIEKNDTLFASQPNGRFRWLFNGREIPGAQDYYLVPQRNGNYRVGARDNYCSLLSQPYIYKGTLLNKNTGSFISFAPNPVHDVLYVQIKSPEVSGLIITDMFGNRMMNVKVNEGSATISVQHLHTGSYLLQALNKNHQLLGSLQMYKQ